MLNVKIIRDVAKSTDGQMQLQIEVKQSHTLTSILQEVAPEVYGACEGALRTRAELMKGSEAEWESRLWEEDSVEDCATLLAAWHGEVMIRDRWMVRSRLTPWIHAEVYIISPYLGLAALPAFSYNGYVFPCGIALQFGPFNRLDIGKLATLFRNIPPPDTWMEVANIFFLLGDEDSSAISTLYALQGRFEGEVTTLRNKIPEEIRQADVTIIDCEAVWEYFKGQFREYINQRNEGRWERLVGEGLP
jgi:hypothetical protein